MDNVVYLPRPIRSSYRSTYYIPRGFYKAVAMEVYYSYPPSLQGRYNVDIRTSSVLYRFISNPYPFAFIELNTKKFGSPYDKLFAYNSRRVLFENLEGKGRKFFCIGANEYVHLFAPSILHHYEVSMMVQGIEGSLWNMNFIRSLYEKDEILRAYIDGKITVDLTLPTCRIPSALLDNRRQYVLGPNTGPVAGLKERAPDVCEGYKFDRTTGTLSHAEPIAKSGAASSI